MGAMDGDVATQPDRADQPDRVDQPSRADKPTGAGQLDRADTPLRRQRRTHHPRRSPLWTAVGVLGELLATLGLVLLLFLVWQIWWVGLQADRTAAQSVTRLEDDFRDGAAPDPRVEGSVQPGDVYALMRVPRFGADWVKPIVAGTDLAALDRGIGHYDDTAAPGDIGNFAVAGHRDMAGGVFSAIDTLTVGDAVVVETAEGWFVYRVTASMIVAPSEGAVIAPNPDAPASPPDKAMLTMTSCHPHWTADSRYVIHAVLDTTYPRADGLPPSVLAAPTSGGQ